ncbi:SusC/RagA family TonB-linked outer membrane protein [Dysgonomonas gadei]|uniref:SusC/RagA family TonB-linked outer membrane protein n=1 Tax=Dysgonomonas gadei TaxID=156974 RepID=UPI003AF142EB
MRMKNKSKKKRKIRSACIWLLLVFFGSLSVFAQNNRTVRGTVLDDHNEPIIGAVVVLKGKATVGTATDVDGKFTMSIPEGSQTLVVSYMGMITQDMSIAAGKDNITIVMKENEVSLSEVIVVGFGQQKKASVVGAITQTTGKVLERAGGVSSIGAALTGNLPGVVTMSSTGMPGEEDPRIIIRGRSSWNNADPLVLVDGIERPMTSVDINSVETISVLKDASATAVYGVRGANGVILITTKRGKEGRPVININVSTTVKVPSSLPKTMDSYDALSVRNRVIESELGLKPEAWAYMTPQSVIEKYRHPANLAEYERYPNVDWEKELLKDFGMSYNANVSISGGNSFVKYFTNVDYVNEGDLFRRYDTDFSYHDKLGYGFDRLNVRSNLDFSLTKSTTLRVNLSGSHGKRTTPADKRYEYTMWAGLYGIAPDCFLPRYSDGSWGYYYPSPTQAAQNSVESIATTGIEYITTDRLTTDFVLEQDLGMLLKGLKVQGQISFDNSYQETERGINNLYQNTNLHKWIDPETGKSYTDQTIDVNNKFDTQNTFNWTARAGQVNNQSLYRRLYYSGRISYNNSFGKHNIGIMGDFSREENAIGSMIPSYRENWVYRTTYDFAGRYFAEYNGAYNGSEKFAPDNRFALFQSGALGWMISEEPIIKSLGLKWLDMMKVRGSYGQIGDDQVNGRWLYMTTWEYLSDRGFFQGLTGNNPPQSPYKWYREAAVGNPNVHWETVTKMNLGLELAVFNGLLTGTFEYFKDKRSDVLIAGNSRAVPSYFGTTAPTANLGKVNTQGYEIELRLNKQLNRDLRLWGNMVYTHAEDKVIEKDDAILKPEYQKAAGKANDQPYAYVSHGYYNNYDELYGSTAHDALDDARMPGNYIILDYDADGIISTFDNVPYGFSGTPQNTINATLGVDYKGWSAFVQFYGVTNVTRQVVFSSLGGTRNTVFDEGSYWSKTDPNADVPLPRWSTVASTYTPGTRYMYDGSYIRLKNAEIGYTFSSEKWVKSLGLSSLKFYLNGNNIWLWTRMPDDRESNFAGTGWASQGAYPTVKRFNIGIKVIL